MNLPSSFIETMHSLTGSETELFLDSLSKEPAVSVRFNPAKKIDEFDAGKIVPWATNAYYLEERPTFTFDPLFHAGYYYVQEASSMFVEQAIRQYIGDKTVRALDLCAAPGGKSTHLRSTISPDSLLVSNEMMRNRVQILAENMIKWGNPNVVVTNNEPADFTNLTHFFDVILTDVPCSGEGMFRKDEVAIKEWSPENVTLCWQRQQDIIEKIWPSLKPGGLLIYSTCTFNTKEDEENVKWICDEYGAEVLPLDIQEEWNITGNLLNDNDLPVYRFLPHRTHGEGFFLAVLRKPDEEQYSESYTLTTKSKKVKDNKKKKEAAPVVTKDHLRIAQEWIKNPADFTFKSEGNQIKAINRVYDADLESLKQQLRVIHSGICLGEVKGRDLIPDHSLAMSTLLGHDSFETCELTYEQAIAYLRKEAISLPETTSKGFILLTYRQTPLGFVKNIGQRANNLYPQEWRIRSGYLPENIKTVV